MSWLDQLKRKQEADKHAARECEQIVLRTREEFERQKQAFLRQYDGVVR